eukprot:gene7847-1052_t
MSNAPLPVHTSCFGVHADIVSSVRCEQYASRYSSYNQRLTATRAQMQASRSAPVQGSPGPAPATASAATSSSQPSAPLSFKQTPVSAEAYQALVASKGGAGAKGSRNSGITSASLAMESAKQHASVVPTSMDFQAIADASVGGGGLPRPYGRFTAGRAGDGTAVWERLPPKRMGESEKEKEKAAKMGKGGELEIKSSSSSPTRPDMRGHHSASSVASYKLQQLNMIRGTHSTPGMDPSCRRPEVTCNKSSLPGNALHRHGDLSRSGGPSLGQHFSLPAATFLSDVPRVPTFLRVDCGHSASKAHLRSGLHSSLLSPPGGEGGMGARSPTSHQGQHGHWTPPAPPPEPEDCSQSMTDDDEAGPSPLLTQMYTDPAEAGQAPEGRDCVVHGAQRQGFASSRGSPVRHKSGNRAGVNTAGTDAWDGMAMASRGSSREDWKALKSQLSMKSMLSPSTPAPTADVILSALSNSYTPRTTKSSQAPFLSTGQRRRGNTSLTSSGKL